MSDDWKQVTVKLRYRQSALIPGGTQRDMPSNEKELVEEIDRAMNASHFGGRIELTIPPVEDTGGQAYLGYVRVTADYFECSSETAIWAVAAATVQVQKREP